MRFPHLHPLREGAHALLGNDSSREMRMRLLLEHLVGVKVQRSLVQLVDSPRKPPCLFLSPQVLPKRLVTKARKMCS